MSNITERFHALNKIPLLDKQHLTCARCEQWLLNEIYSDCQGYNYCAQCKQTGFVRCYTLEHVLANAELNFPCRHEQCDYVGNAWALSSHLQDAKAHSSIMKCASCATTITKGKGDADDIHTKCAIDVHVDELHVDVSRHLLAAGVHHVLNVILTRRQIKHHFLVVIDVTSKNEVCFKVSSPSAHLLAIPEFTVAATNIIHKGVIATEANKMASVRLPLALSQSQARIKVNVYFGGYFDVIRMPVQVCPICFDTLSKKVHQCHEGHCVCSKCIRKKCPICNSRIQTGEIMLESLFPEYTHTCRNAENGCIFVAKWASMSEHLERCSYKTFTHSPMNKLQEGESSTPTPNTREDAIQGKTGENNKSDMKVLPTPTYKPSGSGISVLSDDDEATRPMWPADNGRVKRMVNQFSTDRAD